MRRTYQIPILAAICLAGLSIGGSGCGRQSADEPQAYQWQAEAGDVEKMPYQMTGEKAGWSVQCLVREATEIEKSQILQRIDRQRLTAEENYRVHHVMTQEQYQMFQEQFDRQEQDVREGKVYLSVINGRYSGEKNLEEEADLIYYQILNEEGAVSVSGGVDVRSANGEWYRSENTGGEYFSNRFLPALEGSICRIAVGKETVDIPLVLEEAVSDIP